MFERKVFFTNDTCRYMYDMLWDLNKNTSIHRRISIFLQIKSQSLLLICNVIIHSFHLNYFKLSLNNVCYGMKRRMKIYEIVCYFHATLWDCNATLWDCKAMLWYVVCCKRYAWTDCKVYFTLKSKIIFPLNRVQVPFT